MCCALKNPCRAAALILAALVGAAACTDASAPDGKGNVGMQIPADDESARIFYIGTAADWVKIARYPGGAFVLCADIVLEDPVLTTFTGTLTGEWEGVQHTITLKSAGGLFRAANNALVSSLGLVLEAPAAIPTVTVSGGEVYAGGLTPVARSSTFSNITVTGSLRLDFAGASTALAGGLAGLLDEDSRLENCAFEAGYVDAANTGELAVGALAGRNNGVISGCAAGKNRAGSVRVTAKSGAGDVYCGGLAGVNYGRVEASTANTGAEGRLHVEMGAGAGYLGGIAGVNYGSISASTAGAGSGLACYVKGAGEGLTTANIGAVVGANGSEDGEAGSVDAESKGSLPAASVKVYDAREQRNSIAVE